MERIVVDVQTGEVAVVQFTPEEVAAIEAAAAANEVAPSKPTLADLQAQLAALAAQINELANNA